MEEIRKAIIFDLDDTLVDSDYVRDKERMILRPRLDELIEKLKEVKEKGVEIVLCTTAKEKWVERFLDLKPEFRTIFNRILTREGINEHKKSVTEESHPVECKYRDVDDWKFGKPITTLGYNSILFIDDNEVEYNRLEGLFDRAGGRLNADVTFLNEWYKIPEGNQEISIFEYLEAGKFDKELKATVKRYLEHLRNEDGCKRMCDRIDEFMQKRHQPGLTRIYEPYMKHEWHKTTRKLEDEIGIRMRCIEQKKKCRFDNIVIQKYGNSPFWSDLMVDKHFPNEGVEEAFESVNKRKRLERLVSIAKKLERKLITIKEKFRRNRKNEKSKEQDEK